MNLTAVFKRRYPGKFRMTGRDGACPVSTADSIFSHTGLKANGIRLATL